MPLISSPIFLVLVGIVGLLIGLLVGYLFLDREPKNTKGSGIPTELSKDGYADIARFLYSPSKKRIITGMDGGFFHEVKELTPDQRSRLAKVLRIWTDWSNKPVEEAPVPAAVSAPVAIPVPPAVRQGTPAQSGSEAFEVSSVFLSGETAAPATPPLPEPRPVVELTPEGDSVKAEPEIEAVEPVVKNQTIVEQINDTLQGMITGTPYERRGLTLQDDLQNGVIVYVGGEKYAGIEAVPYPDAQELIRNAVAEWEHRYESEQNHPV